MKKGLIALSPLVVFILLYLVTSIIAGDFYKVPITVAFMAASMFAVLTCGGIPIRQRIDIYSKGAGTGQMMLMIWIFILAGAFANTAKGMGAIDATVNLTFISLSIGTSVGTIVALSPIAVGIAAETGSSIPFLTAVVVGGSFFGDNLSFISDTTIAATSTQGCRLSDKFRVNSFIVVPAAIVVFVIYLLMGANTQAPQQVAPVNIVKLIPYLTVLLTAILGMNVMAVLTIGILLTGVIGLLDGSFDIYGWLGVMGDGVVGMGELIIITMMAGGLLEIIRHNGGIDFIISVLTRHVKDKRGAELSIAGLVSLVDLCTANNTVAILTVGGISKQLGDHYGVDNRKCASILDTFSCTIQGLIPYGAQLLMAAGLAQVNPVSILPYLYYSFAVGIAALLSILLRYPRRYS